MKLAEYITSHGTTQDAFAKAIGVTPEAVRLWCLGLRTPRPKAVLAIRKETGGKVDWQDFGPEQLTA